MKTLCFLSTLMFSVITIAQEADTSMIRFSTFENSSSTAEFITLDSMEVLIISPIGDTMFNKDILFEKELKFPLANYNLRAEIKDYPAIYEVVDIFNDRKTFFFMSFIFERKEGVRKKTSKRRAITKVQVNPQWLTNLINKIHDFLHYMTSQKSI